MFKQLGEFISGLLFLARDTRENKEATSFGARWTT